MALISQTNILNPFWSILLDENVLTAINIPLECVTKGQINNITALIQIMA